MNTPLYAQAALTTESIRKVSYQIHRTESRLWALKKAIKRIPPYCFTYKNLDLAEEIIRAKEQAKNLRETRERLKRETPKELWYPRRKQSGRYNNLENEVKTRIMKDCIRYGFNIKEVAKYFKVTLSCVYRRINIKLYTQVDTDSIQEVRNKTYNLKGMLRKEWKQETLNMVRIEKLNKELHHYMEIKKKLKELILRDLILKDNGRN